MASDGDGLGVLPESELLPDERRAIAERRAELADEESHLTVDEVAEERGVTLE